MSTDPCMTVGTQDTMDVPTFYLLLTGIEIRLVDADSESHSSGDPDGLVRQRSSTAVIGGARSQSPECGAVAARNQA